MIESGFSIHFIHRLHVILQNVIKYFNDYYSCLTLIWLIIFVTDFILPINILAENIDIYPKSFIIPDVLNCLIQIIILFIIISYCDEMVIQVKKNFKGFYRTFYNLLQIIFKWILGTKKNAKF